MVPITPAGKLAVMERQPPSRYLKKFLGVFLFLIGRFEKDAGDLLVTLFLGYACKIGIPVARLRFACECREQILLGLGSFDTFHN